MSDLQILADQNMRCVNEYFGGLGNVRIVDGRLITARDLVDVDVLLVRSVTKVNEQLLDGSKLRFVGTATSGFDHIDQEYLLSNGVGFAHAPGSNANSVVEYVFAAISNSGNKLEQLLAGKPLGIIGYGNIGQALAKRCFALGIDVRVYDPWLDARQLHNRATLAQVLACDVISMHAALTHNQPSPSYHLLKTLELAALKSDTLLINAGRGELIDSQALLELFKTGSGPTAILDVWENEPDISSALLERVAIGTPHIAGYSLDGKILATRMLRDALVQQLKIGAPPVPELQQEEGAPVLHVPRGLRTIELLRWAINARYSIFEDDAALRSKAAACGGDLANDFHQLRTSYRVRRELSGSTAMIGRGEEGQKFVLESLGCNIVVAR